MLKSAPKGTPAITFLLSLTFTGMLLMILSIGALVLTLQTYILIQYKQ